MLHFLSLIHETHARLPRHSELLLGVLLTLERSLVVCYANLLDWSSTW
jgi:hypothetical protein